MKKKSLIGFLALMAGLAAAGLFVCAAGSVGIARLAGRFAGAPAADYLVANPDKIMRRCLMAWGIIALFVLARAAGWRGWRDCGWSTENDSDSWLRRFVRGVGVGLLTMGSVRLAAVAVGCHSLSELPAAGETAWAVFSLFVSGAIVGLLEESVSRGILFRVAERNWGVFVAMALSSLSFSFAHFPSPAVESFAQNGFWRSTWHVAASTVASVPQAPAFAMRFMNLALLGVVLCSFVVRTRSIWTAAGIHAAWVWTIKIAHYLTDYRPAAPWDMVFGRRIDATDSWLPAVFSLAVAAWALRTGFVPVKKIRLAGATWRINPEALRNFPGAGESDKLGRLLAAAPARILKEYPGCRVTARIGAVIKEYAPASAAASLRFALKRGRARRAFETASLLLEHGISVPVPLAWAERRRFGMKVAETLVVREIPDVAPLTDFLSRQGLPAETRKQLLRQYAELAASFHSRGFYNRDLKDENVMVESRGQAQRLWAVDLDGAGRCLFVSRRRAQRDLRRVGLSLAAHGWAEPADQSVFFEAYNAGVPARLARRAFPPRRRPARG